MVYDIPMQQNATSCTTYVTKTCTSSLNETQTLYKTSVMLHKRHEINKLCMTRSYKHQDNETSEQKDMTEMNTMVDAILAKASAAYNVPTMALIGNGSFIVTYKKTPIQLTNEVFLKIDALELDPKTNNLVKVQLSLLSNDISASELATYVIHEYESYSKELQNSLNNGLYMFGHIMQDDAQLPFGSSKDTKNTQTYKRLLIKTAPKHLQFSKMSFYSNKQFHNIYGSEARCIQKRLEFFMNNKSWYDAKGIPYQLGMLLSGLPGTGKTSIIRAIANMTKRHIVHVNFANITTATQLKNIFYNTTLIADGKPYHVPIEKRLYVFEEIDTAGSVLYKRCMHDDICKEKETDVVLDELTLGEVLTVLDGTLEIPGRLLIMTTNHPEVLDPALLRPGRIDINIRFGNASRDLIVEMFEALLDIAFPLEKRCVLPDMVLTPAEVSEVLINICTCVSDEDSHAITARFLEELKTYVDSKQVPTNVEDYQTKTIHVMGAPIIHDNQVMTCSIEAIAVGAPTTSTSDIRHVGSIKHMSDESNERNELHAHTNVGNLLDNNHPMNREVVDETIDSLNIHKAMPKCYGYFFENKTMHVTNPSDLVEIRKSLAKLYKLGYTDNEIFEEMLYHTSTDSINKHLAHKLKLVTITLHAHTDTLPRFQDLLNKTHMFNNVYGIQEKLANYASVLLECYSAYTQNKDPIKSVYATYDEVFTEILTRGIHQRPVFVKEEEILRDICDFFKICESLTEKGERRLLKLYPRSIGYICEILFVNLIKDRFNNTKFGKYCTFGISYGSHVQPIEYIMKYLYTFSTSITKILNDEKVHREISKQVHFYAMKQVLQQYDADIHQKIIYDQGTGSGLDTFFDGNWLSMR